jgi:hypothetical protein
VTRRCLILERGEYWYRNGRAAIEELITLEVRAARASLRNARGCKSVDTLQRRFDDLLSLALEPAAFAVVTLLLAGLRGHSADDIHWLDRTFRHRLGTRGGGGSHES